MAKNMKESEAYNQNYFFSTPVGHHSLAPSVSERHVVDLWHKHSTRSLIARDLEVHDVSLRKPLKRIRKARVDVIVWARRLSWSEGFLPSHPPLIWFICSEKAENYRQSIRQTWWLKPWDTLWPSTHGEAYKQSLDASRKRTGYKV